jgi:two-component system nitrate/nitrite response regulator NarL
MTPLLGSHSDRIRVAIVDDHPIFRAGVKHLLEAAAEFEVVGEGTDGHDVARVVRDAHPDVLLLDVAMPRLNGIDSLVNLPTGMTRVLLLTAAIDPGELLRAIQLGAHGVMLKEVASPFLIQGIQRVADGKFVIGSDVMNGMSQALAKLSEDSERSVRLTPRELEVTIAVANGASNREIAQQLSISQQTVKHYLTAIFDKTGMSTRLELALYAIDGGLATRAMKPPATST